jgi:hypothetical protein
VGLPVWLADCVPPQAVRTSESTIMLMSVICFIRIPLLDSLCIAQYSETLHALGQGIVKKGCDVEGFV